MSTIHVNRIGQKVLDQYCDLIDMSDYGNKPPQEKDTALKSRCIGAYALSVFTGATVEACANSITDGYHDMGIDAIYNDAESKELYFVQSKWINDGNGSPSQGDMIKFIQGFRRILNMDFDGANEKIINKMDDIESALMDTNYHFHLLIVYTGTQNLSKDVKADFDRLVTDLNDITEVVQFSVVNQKVLYDFISIGGESSPISIDDIDMREWGRIQEPYLTYYGYLSCETIAKWHEEYGNRLFAKNIRYFKGSSDTNEGMIKTLLEAPNDFWYFNNGIKILCDDFTKKPIYGDDRTVGLFTARGISVVNGAQTVGCIGTAYRTNSETTKEAKVFVQFISLANAPEGYDIRVTRLSNTQNKIDGRDFAALDPQQDRLKRDMWMDGYNYIYKGDYKVKPTETDIYLDEVTIALACYSDDIRLATLSKRNFGAYYDDITKAPYITIYNSSMNSIKAINLVKEMRYIDKKLSELMHQSNKRLKQMLVHGNRFITHTIMQMQPSRHRFHEHIDINIIEQEVNSLLDRIASSMEKGINALYPDNYLNSLFKNNQKCTNLYMLVEKYIAEENASLAVN